MKNGKAGKGGAHAAYLAGKGKYAERDDVVAVVDCNLPAWAVDGEDFFAAADQHERANGRAYTELEAAIPRGVVDPVKYAQEFAEKLLEQHHPYRLAVHDKAAADGGRNTHMHLMFSDRKLDGIERGREQFFKRAASRYKDAHTGEMREGDPAKGGAAKDRKWNDRNQVQAVRDLWEEFGKARGFNMDLRSNAAKGLGPAEPKLGPAHARAGSNPAREARKIQIKWLREARTVRTELAAIDKHERLMAELEVHRKTVAWRKALTERRSEWARCSVTAAKALPQPGKPAVYRWKSGNAQGLAAVIDYGDRLRPAGNPASISDAKIRAMLDVAAQKGWKDISVQGDAAFRKRVCDAAVARGIGMLDADLKAYAAPALQARQAKANIEHQRQAQPPAAQRPTPTPRPLPGVPLPAQSQFPEAAKQAVETPKVEVGERYARALEKVTSETLATVPGLLPLQAIVQALADVRKEIEAEASQSRPVDLEAIKRQVLAKPEHQRRLVEAGRLEAQANATLEHISSMGPMKRFMYDTKAMTEEANKLMEAAMLERAQVRNSVNTSPEVEAAQKAASNNELVRRRTAATLYELDEVLPRLERGQALFQRAEHIYRVPDAVARVVEKARTITPNSVKGMQAAEVERMTTKAIDVAWQKPKSQREFDVQVSRFVLPAEQRRQLQERDQAKQKQRGPGMER